MTDRSADRGENREVMECESADSRPALNVEEY
jgi:hypothetical protein